MTRLKVEDYIEVYKISRTEMANRLSKLGKEKTGKPNMVSRQNVDFWVNKENFAFVEVDVSTSVIKGLTTIAENKII